MPRFAVTRGVVAAVVAAFFGWLCEAESVDWIILYFVIVAFLNTAGGRDATRPD